MNDFDNPASRRNLDALIFRLIATGITREEVLASLARDRSPQITRMMQDHPRLSRKEAEAYVVDSQAAYLARYDHLTGAK